MEGGVVLEISKVDFGQKMRTILANVVMVFGSC